MNLLAGVAGAADDVRVRHGGRGAVGGGAGRRGGKLHLRRHPVPGIKSTHQSSCTDLKHNILGFSNKLMNYFTQI